jgi:dGTPase
VNALVTDVIEASWSATNHGADNEAPVITMSSEFGEVVTEVRNWMFEEVYLPISATLPGKAALEIVDLLYHHYLEHPDEIPDDFPRVADTPERLAADIVCGMTDGFALSRAESIRPGAFADAFEGRL